MDNKKIDRKIRNLIIELHHIGYYEDEIAKKLKISEDIVNKVLYPKMSLTRDEKIEYGVKLKNTYARIKWAAGMLKNAENLISKFRGA